jgi:AAA+ ATPase superfamily predicted ATPase
MDFVGRERELGLLSGHLERARESGRGSFIAMRGRRRVGKSRLAEEFARASGFPYVYYTATQQAGAAELGRFVEAIEDSVAPRAADVRAGLRPESWEAALALAAEGASPAQPVILVLDEFPYLEQKESAIEAILQKVWDRDWQAMPVLVLLIGSDEAMMEALTEQGRPLYDRLREMAIEPLSPAAVGELLALEAADALDAYLVIGGFPVLAGEWERGRRLTQYLGEALTDPTSFLVVSGERALSAEFPAPAPREVLTAIGSGARAHRAILAKTGFSATTVNETLDVLRERRVVSRLTPYSTKATTRTPLWEIADPYTRFWLAFVDGRIDLIERGRGALLLEHFERSWQSYRGRAIEHVVRDSLELMLPDAERFATARYVGGFWNRASTIEVDLVGGDARPVARRIGFVGSIKWRREDPFSRADGLALAARRDDVPGAGEETLLVGMSSTGFDDDAPLDVRLTPEDLVEAWRSIE